MHFAVRYMWVIPGIWERLHLFYQERYVWLFPLAVERKEMCGIGLGNRTIYALSQFCQYTSEYTGVACMQSTSHCKCLDP